MIKLISQAVKEPGSGFLLVRTEFKVNEICNMMTKNTFSHTMET